jgi:serine/threonine-protein kinase
MGELLVASDEAARAIAEALASRLDAPARKAPTDGSAVELYLRARESLRKNWYGPSTEPLALFAEALRRAPEDPLILAGLAMARARFARTPTDLTEARAVAQRALAAGPRLGEPWIALATVHRHEGDPARQVAALARALELAPRQVEAHYQLGRILMEVGPLERALSRLAYASSLSPGDDDVTLHWGLAQLLAGDAGAADATYTAVAKSGSGHYLVPVARSRHRLWTRGPELPRGDDHAHDDPYPEMVATALREGRLSPAVEAKFLGGKRPARLSRQLLAEIHFAIGDVEAGVADTSSAVAAGLLDIVWFERCPLLEAARTHPAWEALRARAAERASAVRAAIARETLLESRFATPTP